MINLSDYMDYISETPNQSYKGIIQSTINSEWEDTTQLYTIKEQQALPFIDTYDEVEVLLDTISDDMINTSKVYSDFIRIIFKDCMHKQNYRGQYYQIAIDDENYETYICYDRINRLSQIAETKVVRCNNILTWQTKQGKIMKMPCYLGTDITSTNNQISKNITIPNIRMIIFVQANEYTLNFCDNQRFMFEHGSCFKIEEINNYMHEQGTNGKVTFVKMYVNYTPLLPSDNVELNVCDYVDINNNIKSFVQPIDVKSIRKNHYQDFICDNTKVSYTINNVPPQYYNMELIDDGYRLTCKEIYNIPIELIFTTEGKDDIIYTIELRGVV